MSENVLDVVRRRRKQIAEAIIDLQEEDEELEVTERTLVRLSASRPRAVDSAATAPTSHKEMIVSVLRTAAEPWFESSSALHEAVKAIHGVDIKKGSFLPYLKLLGPVATYQPRWR